MSRKITYFLILAAFLFAGTNVYAADVNTSPNNVTEAFELAQTYENQGEYEQAEAIYQNIVTEYPDSNDAMEAQKRLTILYFTWDKQSQGQTAFEELTSDFSENAQIAEMINQIAAHCSSLKLHQKSRQYYQYILDNCPNDAAAIWAQTGLATSNISLEDQQAADTAINELITDFNDHQYLQKAFFGIAAYSHWVGNYQRTKDLCQYVLANWPESEFALWAQMDLACSYVSLDDNENAEAEIERLVANFKDHPKLNWAKFVVGQQYHTQKRYAEAKAIWEQVMAEKPAFTYDEFGEAYLFMGDCYRRLGQLGKAVECYRISAKDYPDYKYGWHALFLTGHNEQRRKKAGEVSAAEADAKTRAVYEQLLEQYPDCKAAKAAQSWLSRNN